MKAKIRDGILIVEAETEAETLSLKEWRKNWHKTPKAEKWFECLYYSVSGKRIVDCVFDCPDNVAIRID